MTPPRGLCFPDPAALRQCGASRGGGLGGYQVPKFFSGHLVRSQHPWGFTFPGRALPPARPGATRIKGKIVPELCAGRRSQSPPAPRTLQFLDTDTPGRGAPPATPAPASPRPPPARPCQPPRPPDRPPRRPAQPPPALTVRLLSLLCRRGATGDPGACGDTRVAASRPRSKPSMAGAGRALGGPHGPAARPGSVRFGSARCGAARLGWAQLGATRLSAGGSGRRRRRPAEPPPRAAASPRGQWGPGRAEAGGGARSQLGKSGRRPQRLPLSHAGGPSPELRLSPAPRRAGGWPGPSPCRGGAGLPRPRAGAEPQRASPLPAAAAGLQPRIPLPRHRARHGGERGQAGRDGAGRGSPQMRRRWATAAASPGPNLRGCPLPGGRESRGGQRSAAF